MSQHTFEHKEPFLLESGELLPGDSLRIAYNTYGELNSSSKVVWVCHALTANSDVFDWWPGLFGPKDLFNPEDYFIICANIIGSCYGSTGPDSESIPGNYPNITIRDMAKAHEILRKELAIEKIHFGIGGSMGGYQLLEWELLSPGLIQNLILVATSARESAWGKGFHTIQRWALQSLPEKSLENDKISGIGMARAIGMMGYRNYDIINKTQQDESGLSAPPFKIESYLKYQGRKLENRFSASSYFTLSLSMDSHDISKGRKETEIVLSQIQSKTLCIGIKSDILCPVSEQQFLALHIPDSHFEEIDSPYGHDGFLVESDKISQTIRKVFRIS